MSRASNKSGVYVMSPHGNLACEVLRDLLVFPAGHEGRAVMGCSLEAKEGACVVNLRRATVLMAHYGDTFWLRGATRLWVDAGISSFLISYPKHLLSKDQAEHLLDELVSEHPEVLIRLVPVSESAERHASFDHALAIQTLRDHLKGDVPDTVIIADPDAWPILPMRIRGLLAISQEESRALLVADHENVEFSHPCVAIFPSETFLRLDMRRGMEDFKHDFGRLWASQLGIKPGSLGVPVKLGRVGEFFYPSFGVMHFSSQSFVGSKWQSRSLLPWRRFRETRSFRKAHRILNDFKKVPEKRGAAVLSATDYMRI